MAAVQDNGESQTAGFIRHRMADCSRMLQKSTAFGIENAIRGELADVWEECSHPNWDGYNALPVTWDSYHYAELFLRALALGTAVPSVGAEPDGQVTLDWGRSPRRQLSVSISADGDLHYAALLGPGKTCGTEPFFGEIPPTILHLIRQVS
ncbi:MAG: hypothetical protein WKF77_02690 [Planctomycetaceae bacterium]